MVRGFKDEMQQQAPLSYYYLIGRKPVQSPLLNLQISKIEKISIKDPSS
jgi:hypothetical protein